MHRDKARKSQMSRNLDSPSTTIQDELNPVHLNQKKTDNTPLMKDSKRQSKITVNPSNFIEFNKPR
jgi:hypothetical protein